MRGDQDGPALAKHDPYAVIRIPNYRRYLTGNLLAGFGGQMQLIAVEWEIYQRTGSELAIGLVGLAQFLPVISLALFSGHVVDTFDRRRVLMASSATMALASVGLALISLQGLDHRWIYACVLLTGIARAFHQPGKAALLPLLVPVGLFANAVTWNSGAFQLATVVGPAVGGALIAVFVSPSVVYLVNIAATLCFVVCLWSIRMNAPPRERRAATWRDLVAGLAYVGRNQVVLGAITLDMFAVLLGGATALLPVYASDILLVGPTGFGWLRAAPGVGALLMSVVLAHRRGFDRAGRALLWSVIAFGLVLIGFGLSRSFWLSLALLFASGALDMISVIIRHTLVQVQTPNELRGRVSAVNGMFIGASNELGAFRAGSVAEFFTPTFAVVSGGVGTVVVAVITTIYLPGLRRYGSLDGGSSRGGSSTRLAASPVEGPLEGPPPDSTST